MTLIFSHFANRVIDLPNMDYEAAEEWVSASPCPLDYTLISDRVANVARRGENTFVVDGECVVGASKTTLRLESGKIVARHEEHDAFGKSLIRTVERLAVLCRSEQLFSASFRPHDHILVEVHKGVTSFPNLPLLHEKYLDVMNSDKVIDIDAFFVIGTLNVIRNQIGIIQFNEAFGAVGTVDFGDDGIFHGLPRWVTSDIADSPKGDVWFELLGLVDEYVGMEEFKQRRAEWRKEYVYKRAYNSPTWKRIALRGLKETADTPEARAFIATLPLEEQIQVTRDVEFLRSQMQDEDMAWDATYRLMEVGVSPIDILEQEGYGEMAYAVALEHIKRHHKPKYEHIAPYLEQLSDPALKAFAYLPHDCLLPDKKYIGMIDGWEDEFYWEMNLLKARHGIACDTLAHDTHLALSGDVDAKLRLLEEHPWIVMEELGMVEEALEAQPMLILRLPLEDVANFVSNPVLQKDALYLLRNEDHNHWHLVEQYDDVSALVGKYAPQSLKERVLRSNGEESLLALARLHMDEVLMQRLSNTSANAKLHLAEDIAFDGRPVLALHVDRHRQINENGVVNRSEYDYIRHPDALEILLREAEVSLPRYINVAR